MYDPIETFEVDGLTVEIHPDDDSSYANPRDCDNASIMVCWHPDYALGDEQIANLDGRGYTPNPHEHSGRFRSIGQLARWARLAEQSPVVLPLYLYDHSGIAIRAGSGFVGRGDTAMGGYDDFGNARGWDTTLCGIVYTNAETWESVMGQPLADADPERVAEVLREDVAYYSMYLEGGVYGFIIRDENGDEIEDGSLWGMLGDIDGDTLASVKAEARMTAEAHLRHKADAVTAWARTYATA